MRHRPADIPDSGFLCDLLWSDPSEADGAINDSRANAAHTCPPATCRPLLALDRMTVACRFHLARQLSPSSSERMTLTCSLAPKLTNWTAMRGERDSKDRQSTSGREPCEDESIGCSVCDRGCLHDSDRWLRMGTSSLLKEDWTLDSDSSHHQRHYCDP